MPGIHWCKIQRFTMDQLVCNGRRKILCPRDGKLDDGAMSRIPLYTFQKHHDGFALFDTHNSTHRSSVYLGPKRDFIRELMDVASKEQPNMHKGTYYSLPEWFNPDAGPYGFGDWPGHLATGNMGPRSWSVFLGLIFVARLDGLQWCDIGGPNRTLEFAAEWYNQATKAGKQVTMNNRCGVVPDWNRSVGSYPAHMPLRHLTPSACRYSYGYNRQTKDEEYRSAETIIQSLVDIVSKNGNYLLNLGPTGEGEIIPAMVERLVEVGEWLGHSGECVFNTTYSFLGAESNSIRFTTTPKSFCIISLSEPEGDRLVVERPVPILPGDTITFLGDKSEKPVPWTYRDGRLTIFTTKSIDTVKSAWAFKITYGDARVEIIFSALLTWAIWTRPRLCFSAISVITYHKIIMIEELVVSSSLLQEALNRYRAACSAVRRSCIADGLMNGLPHELSNRVRKEMELLSSYEVKFHDAKSAISFVRNTASFAPINILPREIMSRIFQLVVVGESCSQQKEVPYDPQSTGVSISNYPGVLTHVCSLWRQIALSSSILWTHIDLSLDPLVRVQLNYRANIYASRAGQLPLYLHIIPFQSIHTHDAIPSICQTIISLAPRTGTLVLVLQNLSDEILETFLKYCTPLIFTRLHLELISKGASARSFIRAKQDLNREKIVGEQRLLDLSKDQLEEILLHITSLHASSPLFPWSSRVYHNLTELRLSYSSVQHSNEISESNFVGILRSSPLLRRLEFAFFVVDVLPAATPVRPIVLEHMEELKVTIRKSMPSGVFDVGCLLRWIAPGSNPLQVVIDQRHNKWSVAIQENSVFRDKLVVDFFSRSNVTQVIATFEHHLSVLADLIDIAPNIRAIILEQFGFQVVPEAHSIPQSHICLDSLYLLRSGVDIPKLMNAIRVCKIRKIFFWGCFISQSPIVLSSDNDAISRALENSSLSYRPTIEYLPNHPLHPTGHPFEFHPDTLIRTHEWTFCDEACSESRDFVSSSGPSSLQSRGLPKSYRSGSHGRRGRVGGRRISYPIEKLYILS
ncbi:glycoside hydrolase family 29 protein [Rhizoctonia solani AG-1 IA]|uniref:alpha-L-fucosidase n=1 Tax=Thanatephorus cucumeris (strain AG1-IA) TaxID=983506 RepID=L8WSA5_THACA|nr:glycoside hydrolase family 29 protein [Rhizoctonia solani AG-1 IA]